MTVAGASGRRRRERARWGVSCHPALASNGPGERVRSEADPRNGLQPGAMAADGGVVTRISGRSVVLALVVLLTIGVFGLMVVSPFDGAPAGSMTGHHMSGMSEGGHHGSGH